MGPLGLAIEEVGVRKRAVEREVKNQEESPNGELAGVREKV